MPSSMTPTTNLHNDVYKRDGDMKSRANNFHYHHHHHREIINETKITNNNKNSSGRNKERETHHRYSYDLSSSSTTPTTKTTSQNNTANGCSTRPITTSKQNKTKTHSPSSSSSHKDSKYIDYENLIKQFEKLKVKAEFFADKDPEFASKLISLANKITKTAKSQPNKMDNQYYPSSYYQQSTVYSTHTNYPSNNIYSTFNSNNFNPFHYNSSQHHHTPPTNPPPPPPPRPPPIPPHAHRNSANPKFSSSTESNNYKYSNNNNTNYSHYSYENSQFPSSHYTRQSTPTASSQTPTFDHNNIYSQCFNFNYPSAENPFSYTYSYTQERPEDLLLILEDPYDSSKITVQLTRTQLGPNGEQQRVTVERDFKSEAELNKFLKEFEDNLNKTSSIPSQTKSPSYSSFFANPTSDESDNILKPGVVVVEEPGEEPKLYRQDTGELVTEFIDPLLKEENNEHPNEIPKQKEEQIPKYYKNIDDFFKMEETQKVDSSNKDSEKASVFSSSTSPHDSNGDLINFDDDVVIEAPKVEPTRPEPKPQPTVEKKPEPTRRPVRRAESFAMPKAQTLSARTCMTNKDFINPKVRHRSSSITTTKQTSVDKPPSIPEFAKKTMSSAEPSRSSNTNELNNNTNKEKSRVKVINMNKNCKRTASLSENLNNIQPSRLIKPTVSKGKENEIDQEKTSSFQPASQFKHQYDKPLLPNHARLGGESSILKRHSSLYSKTTSLPKSESNINCEEKKPHRQVPKLDTTFGERAKKSTEIKSRFSLRETRSNYKDATRRYSQIYQRDSESDISTIHEEKDLPTTTAGTQTKNLDEKKQKFIKNHRLLMSKKLSKSVDTGLSENLNPKSSKYMKINNKLDEKTCHKSRGENLRNIGNTSIREELNDEDTDSEEYETAEIVYDHETSFKSSTKNLNYDFYNYYGYYNNPTQSTQAYFQPNFFQPTKSRVQETDLNSTIQNTTQSQQSPQPTNPQAHYYQGYYASWYGSAPSLRIPQQHQQQRVDNCQSLFFN